MGRLNEVRQSCLNLIEDLDMESILEIALEWNIIDQEEYDDLMFLCREDMQDELWDSMGS